MNSCDFYVKRISSLKTNTAENILSIGLVMKEAKINLSKDDFQSFLKSTHYEEKSSSVRKWIQIGDAYQRLRPIANKLPVAWSTIYKLSKIDSNKFDLLERMNVLHSEITAREIDEHLSVKNRANTRPMNKLFLYLVQDKHTTKLLLELIMQYDDSDWAIFESSIFLCFWHQRTRYLIQ